MIITVTLNPALDKTAHLSVLRQGSLNRLRDMRVDAGGKGVNVSAVIYELGGTSLATGFAGGCTGDELLLRIAEKGLTSDFVRIASSTRTNLKIIDNTLALTELNESGPEVSADEYGALEQKLLKYAQTGNIFVLSGSLPRGLASGTYRRLCGLLRKHGAKVFLDADGEALKAALEADADEVPNFIKPNRDELLALFDFGAKDSAEATEDVLSQLCVRVLDKGVSLVCLSLGACGALFATGEGMWRAPALPVTIRSTVGAGDSMVGALSYGFETGLSAPDAFTLAMATAAGACATEGTNPPSRALVDELAASVRITPWK